MLASLILSLRERAEAAGVVGIILHTIRRARTDVDNVRAARYGA